MDKLTQEQLDCLLEVEAKLRLQDYRGLIKFVEDKPADSYDADTFKRMLVLALYSVGLHNELSDRQAKIRWDYVFAIFGLTVTSTLAGLLIYVVILWILKLISG